MQILGIITATVKTVLEKSTNFIVYTVFGFIFLAYLTFIFFRIFSEKYFVYGGK